MTSRKPCSEVGHDWHEPDGSVYQRNNTRPPEKVAVVCCWCGNGAILPLYGKNSPGTLLNVQHGEYKP